MKVRTVLTCLTLLLLYSCTGDEVPSLADSTVLINTHWRLVAFVNPGQHGTALQPGDTILLSLTDGGVVRGDARGSCTNSYFARYYVGAYNCLQVDSIASTKIACPLSKYSDFLSSLATASSFAVDGERLFIYYRTMTQAMAFERMR